MTSIQEYLNLFSEEISEYENETTASIDNFTGPTDLGTIDFHNQHLIQQNISTVIESSKKDNTPVTIWTTKNSQFTIHKHKCNSCNYSTSRKHSLTRHLTSHSDIRSFKCSTCERGFKSSASLKHHINKHFGLKPYLCQSCSYASSTSGGLSRHIRYKHSNEKPYKCTVCPYSCVERSRMTMHKQFHTDEHRFKCPDCVYSSPKKLNITSHLRIHEDSFLYKCNICFAKFSLLTHLQKHKLVHTKQESVIKCFYCPTTYDQITDLQMHVQKFHTLVNLTEENYKRNASDSTSHKQLLHCPLDLDHNSNHTPIPLLKKNRFSSTDLEVYTQSLNGSNSTKVDELEVKKIIPISDIGVISVDGQQNVIKMLQSNDQHQINNFVLTNVPLLQSDQLLSNHENVIVMNVTSFSEMNEENVADIKNRFD